jgi:hypothetical protein
MTTYKKEESRKRMPSENNAALRSPAKTIRMSPLLILIAALINGLSADARSAVLLYTAVDKTFYTNSQWRLTKELQPSVLRCVKKAKRKKKSTKSVQYLTVRTIMRHGPLIALKVQLTKVL